MQRPARDLMRQERARTGRRIGARVAAVLALVAAALAQAAAPTATVPANASASAPARTLVVVSDDDYPPYIFHRDDGRLAGLIVDEWALWQRKTGVTVDLRPMEWGRAKQAMADGRADVIDTIFDTPERRRTLEFTKPYADLPVPVFVHRDIGGITEPADLRPFVVAAKTGDACIGRLKEAGVRSIAEFDSYTKIVDAAVDGRVRIFCIDAPPANFLLYRAQASAQFRQAFVLYTGQFHRAVHKGDTATLALVEGGFDAFDDAERHALRIKWLGAPTTEPGRAWWWSAAALATLGWGLAQRRTVRRKAAEYERGQRRLRTLIDTLPDLVWLKDPAGRFLGCNPRFEQWVGRTEADLIGTTDDALEAVDGMRALLAADRTVLASHTPVKHESVMSAPDGRPLRILEAQHTPVYDTKGALLGVLGIARDVTQRRATEHHLRRLIRLHEVITAVNEAISREGDRSSLLFAICRILVESGGLRMAWIAEPDLEADAMRPVAWAGNTGDYLAPPNGSISPGPTGDTPCAIAYRTGRPSWSRDVASDPAMALWAGKAQALGFRSSSAFPLRARGRVAAVLAVYSSTLEFFDDDELDLLRRLSDDIGRALEARELDLERERAEQALRESEARFASMFKTSPTGMALCRFEDRAFLDINEAFTGLLGFSLDSLERRRLDDDLLWIDPPAREQLRAALARDGEVRDLEARMRSIDSRVVEVSFSASRIRVGRDDLILATVHDLSVQRLARRTLEERQQELEQLVQQRTAELTSILDAMPDLFFRMLRDGTILDYRAGRRNDLLLAPEQFLGHRVADVMPPEAARPIEDGIARTVATGRTSIVEYPLAMPDGLQFFEARLLSLGDDQVISFVRNITDRKSLETERERARLRAEELADAKSEFLANMSHEIRTPLNGLLGLAQLGLRDAREPAMKHTFSGILDSGRLLLGIVNDVLDFSKLEVGKLRVENQPVSPRALVEDVVAMMRERAAAKDISLSLEVSPGLPPRVLGDPLRIQQVLVNLLSNAVKFTERGGVTAYVGIEAAPAPAPENADDADGTGADVTGTLVFRVTDTGVGIAQDHLQQLFVAFQQADTSTTRRFGGTGLGLAISRRLAVLMGGDIRVRSALGEGSEFELRLPAHVHDEPAADVHARPDLPLPLKAPLAGLRVLVAEDNEVNQMVLERALLNEGAEVVLVGDGQQAVDTVAAEGADAFDVVLMDIQMPVMDGLEATRLILQLAPRLPVIGQTAHAMVDERLECLAAGMVDHVAKPIDFKRLVETLLRHVTPR
jgi:PAS domain S-box-containing protein